jgi:hypothetical protein
MAAMARTPVFPETAPVRALSALLRQLQIAGGSIALDPELPFEIARRTDGKRQKAVFG